MCKKKNFLAILLLALLSAFSTPLSADPFFESNAGPETFNPPCNVPAPLHITWNTVTPTAVLFSWENIPGAANTKVTVKDLVTFTTQVYITSSQNVTVSRNPNHPITVEFRSGCGGNVFSIYFTKVTLPTWEDSSNIIVFDILAENHNNYCNNMEMLLPPQLPPSSDYYNAGFSFNWVQGTSYYLKLRDSSGTVHQIRFEKILPTKFNMEKVSDTEGWFDGSCQTNCVYNEYTTNTSLVAGFKFYPNLFYVYNLGDGVGNYFSEISVNVCKGNYNGKVANNSGIYNGNIELQNNPIDDILTFNVNSSEVTKGLHFRLIDLNGVLHADQQINDGLTEGSQIGMNTAFLPAGIYFLQVQVGDQPVETLKVVKQ